jgi:hypothetical protein
MTILYENDFSTDLADFDDEAGVWSIISGELACSTPNFRHLKTKTSAHAAVADCQVEAVRKSATFEGAVWLRSNISGAISDSGNGYGLNLNPPSTIELIRRVAGVSSVITTRTATLANGDKWKLRAEGTGATVTLKIFLNDVQQGADHLDTAGSRIVAAGQTGFITFSTSSRFDSFKVEDLASGSAPTITDAGDESFRVGETGIAITGTNFGAAQNGGFVKVCPTDDIDDVNGVNLTVTAWGDTSITVDIPGNLAGTVPRNTNVYLFVQNDGALSNASGYIIQVTPPPAVLAAAFLLN